MSTQPLSPATADRQEQTRKLAHHLWEQAGCPTGHDVRFWLAAEKQLASKPAEPLKASAPKSSGNGKAHGTAGRRAQPVAKKAAKAR